MKYYNGTISKDSGFTQADSSELKTILETFGQMNWIIYNEDTKYIIFKTVGFSYFDRELFQEFLNKHSKDEKVRLNMHKIISSSIEYVIEDGEIIDTVKTDDDDYDVLLDDDEV